MPWKNNRHIYDGWPTYAADLKKARRKNTTLPIYQTHMYINNLNAGGRK